MVISVVVGFSNLKRDLADIAGRGFAGKGFGLAVFGIIVLYMGSGCRVWENFVVGRNLSYCLSF